MNLIEFLKSKVNNKQGKKFAHSPSAWLPFYTQMGQGEYDNVVVQQAINCIVKEMKKLYPQHVIRRGGGDVEPQFDSIQRVLENPNPIMTTSDFMEKIIWNLMLNYNSFVLPVWNESNQLTQLWPVQPVNVEFLQDSRGEYWIKMTFQNDVEGTVRYNDVIHLRYNYSVNDWMGGNQFGQPDNKQLQKTLETNDILLNGVAKALKSSFAVNGLVQFNTIIDEEKAQESIRRLEERLNANESGLMGIDLKSTFTQFKRDIKLVDADTLKFVDDRILRHFRVPLKILEGDYTTEEYEAFYQSTLEPIIISMGQAFTKCIFSDHESFGFGHKIVFQPKELIFLSTQQKLESVRLLGDAGALYVNEARTMIGLPARDEYNDVKFQSLNYVQEGAGTEDNKNKSSAGDKTKNNGDTETEE